MKADRNPPVFHPFLLSLYFVVFLVSNNLNEIYLIDAVPPVIAALVVSVLLWITLWRLSKNLEAAGIAVSILVFSFFTYGRVHDFLLSNRSPLQNQKLLFPFWVIITALLVFAAFRIRRRELRRALTLGANVFAIALFILPGISIVRYATRHRATVPRGMTVPASNSNPTIVEQFDQLSGIRLRTDGSLPDIYYIILDGYARNDILAGHFGYQNEAFTRFLEQKGFFVADRATSNYGFTALSLASSLNATYLNALSDSLGERSNDTHALRELISRNAVTGTLQHAGYRIIQIGSWWQVKSSDSLSQPRSRYTFLNEFNIILVSTSILSVIDGQLLAPMMRKNVLDSFSAVEAAAVLPERKFVFAHILCPHRPYLFGRDGAPLGTVKSIVRRVDTSNGFLDQSIFATSRIEQTISRILEASAAPPIIVLQSDHGCGTVWSAALSGVGEPTKDFLQAQFGILSAYLVPPGLRDMLYESISPVNTFRAVFNYLSDSSLPRLEDRSYFSTFIAPYRFRDVTDIVR